MGMFSRNGKKTPTEVGVNMVGDYAQRWSGKPPGGNGLASNEAILGTLRMNANGGEDNTFRRWNVLANVKAPNGK